MPSVTGTAAAGRSAGSLPTLTVSHVSNGDRLYVAVALFGNTDTAKDIGACTYGGVALQFLHGYAQGTYTFQVFRLTSPTPGTANVVYTVAGGGSAFTALGAFNVSGDFDAGRFGIENGSSGTAAVTLVCESLEELIIDVVASDNANQTFTPDAAQTSIVTTTDATTNVHLSLSRKPSAVGTVTMTQTLGSSDTWSQYAFAIPPSTGGGGGGGVSGPTLGEAWS